MKKEQTRNYGIDLLRILAMYMVVLLHVLKQGGILENANVTSMNYGVAWLIEMASMCAVNCYALISGYVGLESKYKYANLFYLWCQVAFYSVGIYMMFYFIHPNLVGISDLLKAFFPVMTSQYWYFTAYFGLFFFIPIINTAVHTLSDSQLKKTALGIIMVYSVIPTLLGKAPFHLNWGYCVLWLTILYLLGAVLKKCHLFEKYTIKQLIFVYIISIIISWSWKMICNYLPFVERFGLMEYTSPTTIIAAICLVVSFSKLKIKNIQWIKKLSPIAFGVYLIHVHPMVWSYVLNGRFSYYANHNIVQLLIVVFGFATLIYAVCSMMDMLRAFIFEWIKLKQKCVKLEDNLMKLFETYI